MTLQSKESIREQLGESAKRIQQVRHRKETERVTEGLQETEPRTLPQVDLTRR